MSNNIAWILVAVIAALFVWIGIQQVEMDRAEERFQEDRDELVEQYRDSIEVRNEIIDSYVERIDSLGDRVADFRGERDSIQRERGQIRGDVDRDRRNVVLLPIDDKILFLSDQLSQEDSLGWRHGDRDFSD